MVARSSRTLVPDLPHDDDLTLPVEQARWALATLKQQGLTVVSARRDADERWAPCDVPALLEDARIASIRQRPACGGVRTTLHVWGDTGLFGATWLVGVAEDLRFRVVLLQALLRSSREE